MKRALLVIVLFLVVGCRIGPASSAEVSSPTVVVLGATMSMNGPVWSPLCSGTAVAPHLVLTALDCVRPETARDDDGILALGIADAWQWEHTSAAQHEARLYFADSVAGLALLSTEETLPAIAPIERSSLPVGARVGVFRAPGRAEKSLVTASHPERGRITARREVDCLDLVRGSGVFDERGRLTGVVVTAGKHGSEFSVPRFLLEGDASARPLVLLDVKGGGP